jgi:nucleoside 2-deoxyribosyltransferase
LEELVSIIASKLNLDPKKNFFLPHRDAGDIAISGEGRERVFRADLDELERCEIVIASLDGPDIDSGTAAELGLAYAKKKKIYGILTDWRHWRGNSVGSINNMIWGICKNGERIYQGIDEAFLKDLEKEMRT